MDFSAFLAPAMQKKDDKPSLVTVNEASEEEVLLLEGRSVPENEGKVRLEVKDRSGVKFRTHEPKVAEWLGQEEASIEDGWNSEVEPARSLKGLWISLGVVFLVGMVWMAVEITGVIREKEEESVDPQSSLEREKQSEIDARQTIDTIQVTVRNFYASSSADEMLKYVRHPDRVGPSLREYYSKNPMKGSEVMSMVNMDPMIIESRGGFWVIQAKLSSGVQEHLAVEVNRSTEAKVDWETYVCAQPMEWDRFVKDRPAGYRGDFRVYIEFENFYNYEFKDSEKYQAYKLTSLNSHEVIYGYAARDGQAFREIDKLINQNKNRKLAVMLQLYLQEGLQSKSGVLIEQFVAPRWLILDSPEVKK